MRKISLLSVVCILAGCATTIDGDAALKRAAETTLPSGWRVDCTDDHTANMRRCYAGIFGKSQSGRETPFQVVFYNGEGPFMQVGFHDDPTARAIVRIDEREPTYLTNLNRYLAAKTEAAHRAEATKIVAEMKQGVTAYARYFTFPNESHDIVVTLAGFEQAYAELRKKQ